MQPLQARPPSEANKRPNCGWVEEPLDLSLPFVLISVVSGKCQIDFLIKFFVIRPRPAQCYSEFSYTMVIYSQAKGIKKMPRKTAHPVLSSARAFIIPGRKGPRSLLSAVTVGHLNCG